MACSGRFLPMLLSLLLAGAVTATAAVAAGAPPGLGLAQRLADGGVGQQQQQQCWEVLMEIKSCTGEIILFFINGEAYLGPGCCRAIRVIEQSCWATDAMLSVIGFTPVEGDMLKGYCDAGDGGAGGQQYKPSPPPPASPAVDYVAARESADAAAPAGRKSLALQHRELHTRITLPRVHVHV